MEVAPRAGDYALMGVAALVTIDEARHCKHARLVYLNAGDGPVEAKEAGSVLEGKMLDAESIDEAAKLAGQKEINPFGNIHASPEFQRHLAQVLTRRTLNQALERASQDALQ
jgi:carbon-monoxide dehydrogenase medium subunit